jgi:hypothetical protein
VPEPLSLGVPVLLLLLSVSGLAAALSAVRLSGGGQKGSGRRWRYTPNRRRRRSDLAAALRVATNVLVKLYNPDPTPDPSIHQAKIVRKTLIPILLVCDFFMTFYL